MSLLEAFKGYRPNYLVAWEQVLFRDAPEGIEGKNLEQAPDENNGMLMQLENMKGQ